MSFRKFGLIEVFRNFLKRSHLHVSKNKSFDQGSKNDFQNSTNLLSQDESKALWIKINQTLQIIH
jgi:hypothetical protein